MSFNGSGTFNRTFNATNDAANGINILASRFDTELDGIATGLSDCVTRDGQSPPTANLPMGGFRHTGVQDGIAANDYASVGQVQTSLPAWIAGGGAVNAITAAYVPAITAVTDGMLLSFRSTGPNTSTTPTFSPNGLTARTIVKSGGVALAANDIPRANYECVVRYNLANTRWELLNPNPAPGVQSGSQAGVASGAATTIFATAGTSGIYLVMANIQQANVLGTYMSWAIIGCDSLGPSAARLGGTNASTSTITVSGTNVQYTQSSGVPQTIEWSAIKIGV